MADNQTPKNTALPEDVAQNPGARMAATHANPNISQEEAENAAAGESPNAAGMGPSTAENHVPASSEPEATDLPTSNAPNPKQVNPKNPNATDVLAGSGSLPWPKTAWTGGDWIRLSEYC